MYSEQELKDLDIDNEVNHIYNMKTEEELNKWIEDMGLTDCIYPDTDNGD